MNNIRKLALAGKSNQIKKILLTSNQLKIVHLIKGETTSAEIAETLNTSVQNAGQALQWLERKGYLSYEEKLCPTGGYYNVYKRVICMSDE